MKSPPQGGGIYPLLHSNVRESRFNVVTKYRSKNKALEKSAYEFFTNMGLILGNMTWAYDAYSPDYHWMIELLERMKLSVRQARSTASPVNKRGIRNEKSGSDGPATGRSQCLMGRPIDVIGFIVIMYIWFVCYLCIYSIYIYIGAKKTIHRVIHRHIFINFWCPCKCNTSVEQKMRS